MTSGPPLVPDADEARRLLVDELGRAQYQAARPTWFDLLAQSVADWFASLRAPEGDVATTVALVIGVVILAAVIVTALVVVGRPRARRSSRLDEALFDVDDARSAAELRASAREALRRGDTATAVLDGFRAISRTAVERDALSLSPGTTARGFSERAATAYPAFGTRLAAAARTFDEVRYLGGTADVATATTVLDLDEELRTTRPVAVVPLEELLR